MAKFPVEKLIWRRDQNYFAGYVVSTTRAGRVWIKYFSDKPDGREAALRRARAFRDRLLLELPWPARVKRRYVLSTSGIIGVTRSVSRTRKGTMTARWIACWPSRAGGRCKVTFSVNRYGEASARRRAIEARRQGLAGLLEPASTSVAARRSARQRQRTPTSARAAALAKRRQRGWEGVYRLGTTVKGKRYFFYRARWSIGGGRVKSVVFAIGRYGEKGARDRAIEARREGLAAARSAR